MIEAEGFAGALCGDGPLRHPGGGCTGGPGDARSDGPADNRNGDRTSKSGGDRTGSPTNARTDGPANSRTGGPEKAGVDLGLAADRVCFAGFSSLCCRFGLPMGQSGVRACGARRHADGVEAVIRRYPKAGTFGVQTRIPKRNTTMKNP